jgi:VIT1/CCC1 family predicted Fe2+/Mn2+ transporter
MRLLQWLRTFDPKKYIKSIVYGGLDGIVTTFAMVASSNGAAIPTTLLFIIGFANLMADALSMSVGDYLSSKAEVEYDETRQKLKLKELESHLEQNKKIVFEVDTF